MKVWTGLLVVAIATCMVASDVNAQGRRPGRPGGGGFGGGPGGFGGGGFGGPLGVLNNERVRDELGVTDDQMDKIRDIQRRQGEQMRERFAGFRDLSDDERRERLETMREEMAKQQENLQKEVDQVLLPQQRDRLRQISLQQQMRFGAQNALTSPAVARELGITDEQREQLRQAARDAEAELQEKTAALREEARKKVLNVLTPSQQEKLKQLIGEPADLGGPGGFGGGFGGGQGGQRFGGQGGGQGGQRFGGRRGGNQERIERPVDGD